MRVIRGDGIMLTVNLERYSKLDFRSNEAYKTLRTNIQFCGSNIKQICFTSCLPNEGKSNVSFNTAVSFAECGKRVVFVDADLRRSIMIGRYKPDQAVQGLTHYLCGKVDEKSSSYKYYGKYYKKYENHYYQEDYSYV